MERPGIDKLRRLLAEADVQHWNIEFVTAARGGMAALLEYADTLELRHQKHLRLIRKLSTDSISPEDAAELQEQVASLVAQVGTCRGYVRELLEILDDTCAKKWRARLAEIKKEMQ